MLARKIICYVKLATGGSADFLNHFFLKGLTFDLEKNCSIHVDLAKSNSRSKRPRTGCMLCSFMLYVTIVYSVVAHTLSFLLR